MGLWRKLFGRAEGCREAMRESYEKHVQLARQGRIPTTDTPHIVGLFGALGIDISLEARRSEKSSCGENSPLSWR